MFMSKKTVALGAIAALAAGAAAPAIAQQQINGSGASFPAPMFPHLLSAFCAVVLAFSTLFSQY